MTCGGRNKRCGTVENAPRIDSFELARTDTWSSVMCGGKWLETYHDNEICEMFHIESAEIALSAKPNGYGGEQLFVLCPSCGERRQYLYQTGAAFLCRKCARLNYRSQQETRSGTTYYYEKGMGFVENYLETWPRIRPDEFHFCKWVPERPRYMHHTTYRRHLRRFLRYRKQHKAREMRDMLRILEMVKEMEL